MAKCFHIYKWIHFVISTFIIVGRRNGLASELTVLGLRSSRSVIKSPLIYWRYVWYSFRLWRQKKKAEAVKHYSFKLRLQDRIVCAVCSAGCAMLVFLEQSTFCRRSFNSHTTHATTCWSFSVELHYAACQSVAVKGCITWDKFPVRARLGTGITHGPLHVFGDMLTRRTKNMIQSREDKRNCSMLVC